MLIIDQSSEAQQTINHSRFIAYALPCANERELRARLSEVARRHSDAHHLAFAYRIKLEQGLAAHCNDAGEPSGTAGRPILAQLEGRGLVNAVVAVIRYFGGVKLGAGGLVRAYGGTARMALEAAKLLPYVAYREARLSVDYAQLQPLTYSLEKAGGTIIAKDFGAQVDLLVRLPEPELPAFLAKFAGK